MLSGLMWSSMSSMCCWLQLLPEVPGRAGLSAFNWLLPGLRCLVSEAVFSAVFIWLINTCLYFWSLLMVLGDFFLRYIVSQFKASVWQSLFVDAFPNLMSKCTSGPFCDIVHDLGGTENPSSPNEFAKSWIAFWKSIMMLGMRMVMGSSVKDRIQQIQILPPSIGLGFCRTWNDLTQHNWGIQIVLVLWNQIHVQALELHVCILVGWVPDWHDHQVATVTCNGTPVTTWSPWQQGRELPINHITWLHHEEYWNIHRKFKTPKWHSNINIV